MDLRESGQKMINHNIKEEIYIKKLVIKIMCCVFGNRKQAILETFYYQFTISANVKQWGCLRYINGIVKDNLIVKIIMKNLVHVQSNAVYGKKQSKNIIYLKIKTTSENDWPVSGI